MTQLRIASSHTLPFLAGCQVKVPRKPHAFFHRRLNHGTGGIILVTLFTKASSFQRHQKHQRHDASAGLGTLSLRDIGSPRQWGNNLVHASCSDLWQASQRTSYRIINPIRWCSPPLVHCLATSASPPKRASPSISHALLTARPPGNTVRVPQRASSALSFSMYLKLSLALSFFQAARTLPGSFGLVSLQLQPGRLLRKCRQLHYLH